MADMRGRVLVRGSGQGVALVLDEPLSFWGGFDPDSGRLIEARHPQAGERITAKVLVMPGGRGSSSSSSVLAEGLRRGTGPAAILLAQADEIILLGALIANLLDGSRFPVIQLGQADYASIKTGDAVSVRDDGTITCSN